MRVHEDMVRRVIARTNLRASSSKSCLSPLRIARKWTAALKRNTADARKEGGVCAVWFVPIVPA